MSSAAIILVIHMAIEDRFYHNPLKLATTFKTVLKCLGRDMVFT
jgi:hypothetical protein